MRFYVSPDSIYLDKGLIKVKDKSEVHHIRDVMRLKNGAMVDIFDGKGREFSGCIEEVNRDSIIIKIQDVKLVVGTEQCSVPTTLYQAIPKKDKMDFIIEKAVELGVGRIVPVITERTVPEIKNKSAKKIERWRRISIASAKQCGRIDLADVSGIVNFNDALLESRTSDLVIFAALDKDAIALKSTLRSANPKAIAIFIGPEGDFSPTEVLMARKAGCKICSLGRLVLKSDTAGIYVLSCLNYELQ